MKTITTERKLAAALKRIDKLERAVADTPQLWKPWPRMTHEGMSEVWRNNKGQYHNPDGPAIETEIIHSNVEKYRGWFINGKRHRLDGPAIEVPFCNDKEEFGGNEYYGYNKYYIDGKKLTEAQFYKHPKCQIKRPKGKTMKRHPRRRLEY